MGQPLVHVADALRDDVDVSVVLAQFCLRARDVLGEPPAVLDRHELIAAAADATVPAIVVSPLIAR